MKIKNNIKKNFTIVPNELILDNSLSDRARFIFVYMASKPDDWNFYMSGMCKELNLSKETTTKYISELKASGWLTSLGQTLKDGKYSSTGYELNHKPKIPCTEKPDTENSRHGKNLSLNNMDFKQTSTLKEEVLEVIVDDVEILKTDLEINLEEYVKIRKKMKKPFTDYSYKLMLEKLEEFSKGDENTKIEILKRSIMNNYQGIFELPKTSSTKNQTTQPEQTAYGIPLSNWQEGYDKVKGISISSELKNRNNEANR